MADAHISGDKLKLFISYSRRDMTAADALVLALEGEGFEVTIDRRDLPYGEEWQKELADFIRGCDTIVWLVSPDSIKSKWCNWELGEVGRLNKRLVPVNIRGVLPDELPETLGKVHLLPADGVYEPKHLSALVETLNTDRSWVKGATRLADRAHEWIARDRNRNLLLRGPALKNAEIWSTRTPKAAPSPAGEVLELILASRRGAARRQRWAVAGALVAALVGFSLAGAAWWQRNVAVERQNQALANESRILVGLAERDIAAGDSVAGMLLALFGLPDEREGIDRPYVPEVEQVLYRAWLENRERFVLDDATARPISARLGSDGKRVTMISEANVLRSVEVESRRELAVARGTEGAVTRVFWSPDGNRLVAVSSEERASLWDLASGRELTVLPSAGWMERAVFSPDSGSVATISEDNSVRVYDAVSGEQLATLAGPTAGIRSAAFSPDGRLLATGSEDGEVLVWEWASNKEPKGFQGHEARTVEIFFTPNGDRLVTLSWDRTVRIWDIRGVEPTIVLSGHDDIVLSAALSPDGKRLVTGSQDNTARLWDLEHGREILPILGSHTDDVVSVAFSSDGGRVVTASNDSTARIWEVDTGRQLATLKGHEGRVVDAAFSADGRLVVTCGDNTVRIWDSESARERGVLKGHEKWVLGTVFSRDGQRLVTVSSDQTARLWEANTGQETAVLRGHRSPIVDAAFDLSGQRLITVSWDGTARVWNGQTGEPLGQVLAGLDNFSGLSVLSRDGKRLVTTNADHTVAKLWDVENGKELASLTRDRDVQRAAFNANGGRVLTIASNDTSVEIWNAVTGDSLGRLPDHEERILAASFSPDGQRVATASKKDAVTIWDVSTRHRLLELPTPAHDIAFSADGKQIVAVWGNAGRVWNADNGQEIAAFATDERTLGRALFSPDGKRIVTEYDARVHVWNALTGNQIAVFEGHTLRIEEIAFSPDSTRLATAADDTTARIWPMFSTTGDLQDRTKASVPRCLSGEQLVSLHAVSRVPDWCITGPGREAEPDPAKWEPKWPYSSAAWRQWLVDKRAGKTPTMPSAR